MSGRSSKNGADIEPHGDIELGIKDYRFSDLFDPIRLASLTEEFYRFVEASDSILGEALRAYTAARGEGYEARAESNIITSTAPHLSAFIAKLFDVEVERERLQLQVIGQDPIWKLKFFIQRRAIKKYNAEACAALDAPSLENAVLSLSSLVSKSDTSMDEELATAVLTETLLKAEEELTKGIDVNADTSSVIEKLKILSVSGDDDCRRNLEAARLRFTETGDLLSVKAAIDILEQWAAIVFHSKSRRWYSIKTAHPLDYQNLVRLERPDKKLHNIMRGPEVEMRRRDGFKLTDPRGSQRDSLYEIDYCMICHEREKDGCSKGLREKDGTPKRNPLGIKTEGCPLDEKISEMHLMKKQGDSIASLAIVTIDNPMCTGTGHRICNDCMKGCIFQKQEPVNIPMAETASLTDVLNLPYGFEIYSLLTRWNPLNAKRPHALPYNGKNILVVGMGPAGYTLAHYLINEGFGVVGIDGLKIEPLPSDLTGDNGRKCPKPIRDIKEITSNLDERILSGFGGVSEYGITVRWDKNFLTMTQLMLFRRNQFKVFGGIRFGGTLTIDDAWEFGFDHIAIATGAGRPTIVPMKNNMIRGIRKASDFLMALQLTGAFKKDTLSNLQVRMPAIVIGGGLTGIDTATELMAYYPIQVEKMLENFESVSVHLGEEKVWSLFDDEETLVLKEFLSHGRSVREERIRASKAGEVPDFAPLVRSWGGVSLVYRKRLQDSPAYRLNHEEVQKAFEEGINIIELLSPTEAIPDSSGAVEALVFEKQNYDSETGKFSSSSETVTLPARTVCVAAGTSPNVIYEREFPGTFKLDEWKQFFQPHRAERQADGNLTLVECGKGETGFFTSYNKGGRLISYYGDNHPRYAGNVVKAMASAKHGHLKVSEIFADHVGSASVAGLRQFDTLVRSLEDALLAHVVKVDRLTPTIVDVIVRAPLQAKKFEPGQFYRLQNYESGAKVVNGKKLMMEGLALTGAWVDKEQGLLSMIVLEMGTSSRLCATLEVGEEVVVMGPTGTPTEIPENEAVMLAGGGLGNAVLFSIAKALREKNNKVIYFAGYKNGADLFKREEIENATDQVIWATDAGVEIGPNRSQDAHFRGNIVQAMIAYAEGKLGDKTVELSEIDRIIAIGSDRMMNGVKEARFGALKPFIKSKHTAIGSINSPMQCMMKEVCAQCLQRHIDPETGKESFVFSCYNQDQVLDFVDFNLS
jgi:NADPH-dependent glutamate synthase beta subunit-like oxidoreductase/NAD(P)H-flavin reductase